MEIKFVWELKFQLRFFCYRGWVLCSYYRLYILGNQVKNWFDLQIRYVCVGYYKIVFQLKYCKVGGEILKAEFIRYFLLMLGQVLMSSVNRNNRSISWKMYLFYIRVLK